ncbi:MAG: TIGR01212 family radical SAM protein [Erysipelotrichaceae bacterium]|nr:TIGR01212 family radical SAM protein [Erysipelotrichaceae bacterium]MDY5251375.1 TIGR01212 family radical SAM protein [Erysipelotrichaceae bacterium]
MKNPFIYSDDNKRYHTFNYYLRHKYGQKVYKVPLDAHFSCPNRDGTCGYGGCIFCSSQGSGEFAASNINDIIEQFEENKKMMEAKWPNSLAIPYFQAFSNTYGPLSKIKACIEPFINYPKVCAIAIATRPDCLDDEKIAYLASLTTHFDVYIELGLQSSNDDTAQFINRGHDFACLQNCVEKLNQTPLKTVVHIINGLPNETSTDMLKTIKDVNDLKVFGIKIHMLHISQHTVIANMYKQAPWPMLSMMEYVDIVIKQLELLDQNIVIERLTGDPVKDELIAPSWVLNKTQVLNEIDKKMALLDTYQGKALE